MLALVAVARGETKSTKKVVIYAAIGSEVTEWDLDTKADSLTKRTSIMVPDSVQEAATHPSHRYIYIVWSNGVGKDHHGVTAYHIDPETGALSQFGPDIKLPARPIHCTTDITGKHLLIAYNDPSGLSEHEINADGSIGKEVKLPSSFDFGTYAHQIRVDPTNKMAILVTRGNAPTAKRKEDPGALKIFSYSDGTLTKTSSVAPKGGFGFQARHLDFSPNGPWIYLSLEKQNMLDVYKKLPDGNVSSTPLFTKDSLRDRQHVPDNQSDGTVHMHPNGRFLYQANRTILPVEDAKVGENSIAVWSINQQTGEPTRIQNIDTRGITPRTFALDPTGSVLVVGNQNEVITRDKTKIPASLAVFKVRGDGKLDFVRKYDVEANETRNLWWMGLVELP